MLLALALSGSGKGAPAPSPHRPEPPHPRPRPKPGPPTPGELGVTVYPVTGKTKVISPYGPRGGTFHYGVDIAPDPDVEGRELVAMTDGHVSYGNDPKGGNIALLHMVQGGAIYYAHMQDPGAWENRDVKAGEVIGRVGMTGNAATTVPHVHIEYWPNGQYEPEPPDPTPLLATAKKVAGIA
jgi:murein DD-endopeptidase MepM/ murein hydrolase activator NlpD